MKNEKQKRNGPFKSLTDPPLSINVQSTSVRADKYNNYLTKKAALLLLLHRTIQFEAFYHRNRQSQLETSGDARV